MFKLKRKLNYISGEKVTLKLSEIKISDDFIAHPPMANKLATKYFNYIRTGKLEKIIIDTNGVLLDGYCVFLISRMFGVEKVKVEVR